jgi:hypothetical protein
MNLNGVSNWFGTRGNMNLTRSSGSCGAVEEIEDVKTEVVDENTLLEELVSEDDVVVDWVVY